MHITTPSSGSYPDRYRSHFGDSDHASRRSANSQSISVSTTSTTNVSASASIAPVDAATAVAKPAFDAAAISKNILGFIEQRLSKAAEQGASKDQLADLLAQARQGVSAGFGQAVDQLKGVGAFDDALSSGISSALQKVDSGLDDLAKQFGLSTSTAATPAATPVTTPATTSTTTSTTTPTTTGGTAAPSTNVNTSTNSVPAPQTGTLTQLAAAYRGSFSSKQSVDLVVKTADGDTVHLQLGVRDKQTISAAYQSNGNGQQLTISSSQRSSAGLSISVDGNLDDGELNALGDLLDQLGDVADSFFSGDVGSALQQAGSLDFSNPELDSFSLDLRSTVTSKAKVAAYAAVQSLANDDAGDQTSTPSTDSTSANNTSPSTTKSLGLADLFSALSALVPKASVANNPASLLKQLLAAQIGAAEQQNNPLLSFADRLLTALGADAAAPSTAGTSSTAPATTSSTSSPTATTAAAEKAATA